MDCDGTRKGGTSAHTGANKCPVDTYLARGRVHTRELAASKAVSSLVSFGNANLSYPGSHRLMSTFPSTPGTLPVSVYCHISTL